MSRGSEDETELSENVDEVMDKLLKDIQELYEFRDLFFETHPIEMAKNKNQLVEEKKKVIVDKFEKISESQIPVAKRAEFLYMKGRCYNISPEYDPRAIQYLSKAVKLNPQLIHAWNELGEAYWKNMSVAEAKASFEGALKHERNCLSLRCLSIILRQETESKINSEKSPAILKSVELAKEAVTQNIKDGVSWTLLGNAYLCQFFMVAQDPATLKLCMSAYKQALMDPIAKGQPDLYYNRGIALKYEEEFEEALNSFDYACRLDPPWEPSQIELKKLAQYLTNTNDLVRTKGKIKTKKLTQMTQAIDKKSLGVYSEGTKHNLGSRKDVILKHSLLDQLQEGNNDGVVILGKVVGSIHNESAVPFTFAIVDESMQCVCVTVYNWADGWGAIIGDSVTILEPKVRTNVLDSSLAKYNFKSIRVNNPLLLLINGKRVGRNQFASTRVTSTYEIH